MSVSVWHTKRRYHGGQTFSTYIYFDLKQISQCIVSKTSENPKMIYLNYSKDMLRMVGPHFFSLDENGKIYGHGWNFNMADIECIFRGCN